MDEHEYFWIKTDGTFEKITHEQATKNDNRLILVKFQGGALQIKRGWHGLQIDAIRANTIRTLL